MGRRRARDAPVPDSPIAAVAVAAAAGAVFRCGRGRRSIRIPRTRHQHERRRSSPAAGGSLGRARYRRGLLTCSGANPRNRRSGFLPRLGSRDASFALLGSAEAVLPREPSTMSLGTNRHRTWAAQHLLCAFVDGVAVVIGARPRRAGGAVASALLALAVDFAPSQSDQTRVCALPVSRNASHALSGARSWRRCRRNASIGTGGWINRPIRE